MIFFFLSMRGFRGAFELRTADFSFYQIFICKDIEAGLEFIHFSVFSLFFFFKHL